jgi:hypothetical protein
MTRLLVKRPAGKYIARSIEQHVWTSKGRRMALGTSASRSTGVLLLSVLVGYGQPVWGQSATQPAQLTDEVTAGNPAHPKDISVGGTERQLPDHGGLLPHGPVSLIYDPIQDLKAWTSENWRLDLGARAAFFFQQASGGPGERTAASQDYRVYGTWHAINWEEGEEGSAGNVYFRTEYRGEMGTKIPVQQIFTQIGALTPTAYGQDEHDFALVQFYYEQFLFDGDLRLRAGKIDPDDYFNLGRFADDYRYFSHTLFSDFPASNHPSGGLGFNAQWYISPEWTLTGGFSDVQGRKTESGFSTFDEGKFIYGLDVTYSPKIDGLGQGNYRFGVEYRDGVEDKGRPSDTAFYINIDQEIAKDFAPFIRWGHGTGRSTGVEDAFSAGLGIDNCFNRPGDAFGVGFGFATADESVDSPRDVEYAGEIFYRLQLSRAIQYTIGGQIILDPVNNPDQDVIGIFEMRLVIDF